MDQFCGMDSDVEGMDSDVDVAKLRAARRLRSSPGRQPGQTGSQTSSQDNEVITRTIARADRVTDK